MTLKLIDFKRTIFSAARFGLVGILATAIYLIIAVILPEYSISPTLAAAIASIVSVGFSYLGHHSFTFSKSGLHEFYLPRFLIVSTLLSAVATATTFIMTNFFGLSANNAAVVVAIFYPIFSFALNNLWVFGQSMVRLRTHRV